MKINFGSKLRCERNRQPIKIISSPTEKSSKTKFSILDKNDSFVGRFYAEKGFSNTVVISGLNIPEALRGKKIAASIILAIRDFALKKAKEEKIECIQFDANINNPHNVKKLYQKMFPDAIVHTYPVGRTHYTLFSVPMTEQAKEIFTEAFAPEHFAPNGVIKVPLPDANSMKMCVQKLEK